MESKNEAVCKQDSSVEIEGSIESANKPIGYTTSQSYSEPGETSIRDISTKENSETGIDTSSHNFKTILSESLSVKPSSLNHNKIDEVNSHQAEHGSSATKGASNHESNNCSETETSAQHSLCEPSSKTANESESDTTSDSESSACNLEGQNDDTMPREDDGFKQ